MNRCRHFRILDDLVSKPPVRPRPRIPGALTPRVPQVPEDWDYHCHRTARAPGGECPGIEPLESGRRAVGVKTHTRCVDYIDLISANASS